MGKETIPLAKPFKPEKLDYPVYLSVKHDGVPVKIRIIGFGNSRPDITVETRQGEPVPSVAEYIRLLSSRMQQRGVTCDVTLVAEITHETLSSFKDVSGLVRKHTPQTGFIFNVFDFVRNERPDENFTERQAELGWFMRELTPAFVQVEQIPLLTPKFFEANLAQYQRDMPNVEGFVARSGTATFKPGARHWDYQKIVVDPTVDLRIIGMEEAIEKSTGLGKGMVGRLVADFKGTSIGIGPGKLSHDERRELWAEWVQWQSSIDSGWKDTKWSQIATIKYKRDDSYDALRQPTFQHWRPEKTKPNYEDT